MIYGILLGSYVTGAVAMVYVSLLYNALTITRTETLQLVVAAGLWPIVVPVAAVGMWLDRRS